MPIGLVLAAALLIATALEAQAPPPPEPLLVRVKGYRDRVRLDTGVVWTTVPGTPAQTFRNAVRLLDSLDIPVKRVDSVRGVIHDDGFSVRVRLAGHPISRSFRCGAGLLGDHADTWRVNVAHAIYVRPHGDSSRVGFAFAAGATDVEGASKPPIPCGRTGHLETLLHRILVAMAAP